MSLEWLFWNTVFCVFLVCFSSSECCTHHSPCFFFGSVLGLVDATKFSVLFFRMLPSSLPKYFTSSTQHFQNRSVFSAASLSGSFYAAAWAKPALGSAQLRSGAGCRCDLDQTGVTSLTCHCSERRQSVCCTFRLQLLCYRQQMTYSGMRAMLDSALKPSWAEPSVARICFCMAKCQIIILHTARKSSLMQMAPASSCFCLIFTVWGYDDDGNCNWWG